MVVLRSRSLMTKLIVLFLMLSLLPIAVVGYLSFTGGKKAVEKAVFEDLVSARELRKNQIAQYFERAVEDATYLSHSKTIEAVAEKLRESKEGLGQASEHQKMDFSSERSVIQQSVDEFLKEFSEHYGTDAFGYYDVMLVDSSNGEILYSLKTPNDMGASLLKGPLKDSGPARVLSKVSQTLRPAVVDFSYYPSHDGPLAFLGVPVLDRNGKLQAVSVLAIDPRRINWLMKPTEDMRNTGQAYLVGQDFLMRSQGRFDSSPSVLKRKVEIDAVKAALRDEKGTAIMPDDRGTPSLISFSHVGLNENKTFGADFEWAIITDLDLSEAFADIRDLEIRIALIGIVVGLIAVSVACFSARGVSRPLRNGIQVLASASSEISTTVSQLAASSSETASAVTETTATLEELRQSGRVSNDKAKSVAEDSRKSLAVAREGKKATEETIQGMGLIKTQMDSIGETVIRLSEQSQSIEEIIGAVKDLAEQSNLLAVNAAIEAARAGEQGKGFSVVADEIKSLADQSKRATAQVRTILDDIRTSISGVVMATERGNKAVEAGVIQSSEAGNAIHEVTRSVHEASQALTVIVASADQQAVGVDQVATAMDSIDQAMRQNVEGTRQLEDSAKNLNDLGSSLKDLVEGRKTR